MSKALFSRVGYATFANYSPRGASELSKQSREVCYKFKNGNIQIIQALIRNIGEILSNSPVFGGFFGTSVTLVPVPRSSLLVTGGLWPAKLIADHLLEAGFAREVRPCLVRLNPVPRSSAAGAGQRPTVLDHYNSFGVSPVEMFQLENITLVDDVLTKGSTAFAGAMRLHETFPGATIRVFAPVRTQGLVSDITALKDPAAGEITFNGFDTTRTP